MSAAVVLSHVSETAHAAEPVRARAKTIARPERLIAARVFAAACESSGLSNRCIARWLGIDEHHVRDMQDGHKPISLEQLLLVPPSVETAVGVGLIEQSKARAIGGGR